MSYEIKVHTNRTVFYFFDKELTYEKMVEMIDLVLQPDEKSEEEITSWTEGFVFKTEGINVYFEYFYHPDHYFSFELYPIGNDSKKEIAVLKTIVDKLDSHLFK